MADVRYLLMELPSQDMISWDTPLEDVEVSYGLSTPTTMRATISHERPELVEHLKPFGAAVFVDDGSGEMYGGILTDAEADDTKISLTVAGYSYYPANQPWLDKDFNGIQVDPLAMVRKIWAHLQSYPSGDLKFEIDSTKSKVRIGTKEETTEFTTSSGEDVSFESGPFRLNWYTTSDLGKEVDDLMTEAGASYLERHYWEGDTIKHFLQIDSPSRAVRRTDVRLVVGENVIVPPRLSLPSTSYASHVLVVGAGEGSKAAHADVPATTNRLRRALTIADKSITSKKVATNAARNEVARRKGDREEITEITVLDHPNADFRLIDPGDIIRVSGETEWIDLDTNAIVVSKTWDPSRPETGVLELQTL